MRVISAVVGLVVLVAASPAQDAGRASPSLLKASFSKFPIYFIENRGVYPNEVAYYVQGADKTLFFTKGGITFRLKGKDRGWVVKLEFVGANPDIVPRGEDQQQAVFSYFKGPEKDWKTGLTTYAKVVYRDLWPGIDLVYEGTVNKLKYEFVVKPGADPRRIRLRYTGATAVRVLDSGALRVETPVQDFEDAPPVAWQDIDDKRVPVDLSFRLGPDMQGEGTAFGVRVGEYDHTRPMVLDPAVLVYCGYVGGTSHEYGYGIAVDAAGNAYVTGSTQSAETSFPVKVGPDLTSNGNYDVFVAKVNAKGTALVYSGFIGGRDADFGFGIAVDAMGRAYVTGYTMSDENTFPVKIGPGLTHGQGLDDCFVVQVNAQGTALGYCGYIGGNCADRGYGIAVDTAGNAYVTGATNSPQTSFPVKTGPGLVYSGGTSRWPTDAFVARVNAGGSTLGYCGYIGGSGDDVGLGIAVDVAGSAHVTGYTASDERAFPVKVGPDLTYNGMSDTFVAKVNPKGTALVHCGYIGGTDPDCGAAIAVDATGSAYVTGYTRSRQTTFPVRVGPDLTHNGGLEDCFVTQVNAQGTALVYCGYLGGSSDERGSGIAVDAAGNAYVTGLTSSTEATFPVKVGPDLVFNGGSSLRPTDAFVAKVIAGGTALVYCGYIGGSGDDSGCGIAADAAGNAYVTGETLSSGQTFPVTVGPDLTYNGLGDGFVAKVSLLDDLSASGPPRPGGTITLSLVAVEARGLPYQLGTSLGAGPIPIDTRQIGLDPDALFLLSIVGAWPGIFSRYGGVIDSKGQAQAAIHIPNIPALIGVRLHSAFVTLDTAAPSGIRSISNTFSFSVTK